MLKSKDDQSVKDGSGNEDIEIEHVRLLPLFAHGGSLSDFTVSVKDSDCEKVVSPVKGADFAIQVTGDSMAPEYPSGSVILIKKINESAFIEWGKAYMGNYSRIARYSQGDDSSRPWSRREHGDGYLH